MGAVDARGLLADIDTLNLDRRNTDRFIHHRLDQIALAIALVITIKLIKWADRFKMAN